MRSTSSAPTSSTPAPPSGPAACAAYQLQVSSARGGASQGIEFAALIFTNTSTTACTLRGYPSAQLLRAGRPLGRAAVHQSGTSAATVLVRPQAYVQAQLSAVSTCQSPLSDHVRAVAPGTATPAVVAVELRGCAVTVGPVEAP